MRIFHKIACSLIFFTLSANATTGIDLKQIFEWAKLQDSLYLATQASSHADTYNPAIAISALLPQLDVAALTSYSHRSPGSPAHYNVNSMTFTLTQSLVELDKWKRIAQANKQERIANLASKFSLLDLILRASNAYFDVLSAQDQLRFAQKNEQALQEQYHQTEQRFQVGATSNSDLQLTLAAYAEARAIRIHQANEMDIKKEALSKITGQELSAPLTELSVDFNPELPLPEGQNSWADMSLHESLLIQQAILRSDIQDDEITIARTGFLPRLTGSLERINLSDHHLFPQKTNVTSAGVDFTLNVWNGGGTFASIRKAQYEYQASLATLEETRRTVASNVRQDYLNLMSDLSQIKAYAQAVTSAEASFKAAQAAYQAGSYTIVAVLQEQSRLFSSEKEFAQARYRFIRNWIKLKLDTGILNEQDIDLINQLLTHRAVSS